MKLYYEGGRLMAEFQELIKNFDRIRDYMRQFYVYGFKVRNDFDARSARTYDNERRSDWNSYPFFSNFFLSFK